jgi:hypothetical protein
MLQELSIRLSNIIQQKRLKEKLEQDLLYVETELQDKYPYFISLTSQLEKEKIDVAKLESISLTSLFYSALGSRDQQLEKERQELLSAQLLYQQNKKLIEFLVQEKSKLSTRLEKLTGIDAEYELALSEKESAIQQSSHTVSKELLELSEPLANLNSEVQEITEALTAGNGVILELDEAIKSLDNAGNWGVWDMLGGGFISDMIKHSHIDAARNNVNNSQTKISQFQRELADVQKNAEVQIDIGELASFADFFLDGLIFDWVVQSKIENSLSQARSAKTIITQTIKELEKLKMIARNKRDKLQEKRAFIIEHS